VPAQEITAKRYAEAAFGLARDRGEIDRWVADLAAVAEVLNDKQVRALLDNPRVPETRREEMLDRALAGVSPLVLNFAKLLARRHRVDLIDEIVAAFNRMVDEYRGIVYADVTVAVPISEDEERYIRDRLSAMLKKDVRVRLHVDPRIIGGVIARVGDHVIDGSTRTRLLALRRRLAVAR